MNKIFRDFSVITASLLVVLMVGCKSDSSSPTAPSSGSPPPASNTVSMAGNTFSPSALTVAVHATVTWNNNSSITHTSTSDIAGKWDTGNISAGSTAHTIFDSTGTFHYHCTIHPGMTGTITVQ
jgi:plastocyanin